MAPEIVDLRRMGGLRKETPFTRINSGAIRGLMNAHGVTNQESLIAKLARNEQFHRTNIPMERMERIKEMLVKFRGEQQQIRLPKALMLNLAKQAFEKRQRTDFAPITSNIGRPPLKAPQTLLERVTNIAEMNARNKAMRKTG